MMNYWVAIGVTLMGILPKVLSFSPSALLPSSCQRQRQMTSRITHLFSTTTVTTASVADPTVVSERVFKRDRRPIILFDGVCNMCNSAVNLALDWDPDAKLRFAALQSNVGRALLQANGREADDISSIVLVTSDGAFIKSDAILRITEELTPKWLPLPLAKPAAVAGRYLIPGFFRDLIYDGVADNRYEILGIRDECRFGDEDKFAERFVDDSLAVSEL